MTIDLPEEDHRRLAQMAREQGITVEQLLRDMSIEAARQHDAYLRFRERAARGDPKRALEILDKLDRLDAKS